ncbi:hypothetical protein ACFSVK_19365 [Azorhizophilus paspali]|uniref:Uncharacterized protein n=1 Tax=Azorhizophilus paspali TaxID=69963 RepID=A0ABV6SH31_AZOPA
MSTLAIAATTAYRSRVALAAAEGGPLPRAAWLAFGADDSPYSLDDTALGAEWLRVATTNVTDGPLLTVTGVLDGAAAGLNVLREVGVFAADGTLMGRRVLTPKELEPGTVLEFEITFQY